ncbi:hypothetical protein [Paenibacillus sp. 481]|uniref:hypothetical protein n=1 Tax=Paenibacillus sp. 481 TaxID=2835869 RepID=UPI001E5CF787|nr:hypothetical protein [Paenibacillus sp. 481]UHA74282.1 hypothetical protein KIK04_03875 [Paenibacillus sp. 481]
MIRQVKAHVILDLKILFTEKVALAWSVALPVVIALVFQGKFLESISSEEQFTYYLSWFWIFIIIASFVNGIGLQIARLREYNLLKTYVLIAGAKHPYVISVFITQCIFVAVSNLLFTTILSSIVGQFTLLNFILPLLLWFMAIPIGMATLLFAVLPLKLSSVTTFINIALYPLFLVSLNNLNVPPMVNWVNPFTIMRHLIDVLMSLFSMLTSLTLQPILFIMLGLYFVIGLFSYKKLSLLSLVQR